MARDGYAALAIFVVSALLYWATLGLQQHPLAPVSPGFYPRIVLGITAGLAVLLAIQDVLARRRPRAPRTKAERAIAYGRVMRAFGVFAAYVLALPYLGFRIATCAFVLAMQATLEWPRGARRWLTVIAVAIVATAITYFVFERYLMVLLPRGRWTSV
jgi:hypothetical protein